MGRFLLLSGFHPRDRMDAALALAWDSPPLSIIAAAKIAGVSLTIDPSLASGSAPTLYLGSV